MKGVVEDHDGEALSEHVDFLSVRQSLKDKMNAVLAKEIGALGAAFVGMFVEKMVDVYITPNGSYSNDERGKSQQGSFLRNQRKKNNEPFQNASLSYESLSKFSISVKEEIKFILKRTNRLHLETIGNNATNVIANKWLVWDVGLWSPPHNQAL